MLIDMGKCANCKKQAPLMYRDGAGFICTLCNTKLDQKYLKSVNAYYSKGISSRLKWKEIKEL